MYNNVMNKKALLFLSVISSLLITSCGSANKIVVPRNFDYELGKTTKNGLDLNTQKVVDLFNSKGDFIFYMYEPNCSTCINSNTFLDKYIKSKNTLFYKLNLADNASTYNLLTDLNPDIFSKDKMYVPRLFFVENGEVTTEMASSKFNNDRLFSSSLNAFSTTSKNIFSFINLESYKTIKTYENPFIITYNSSLSSLFNEDVYELLTKANGNYYIVDTNLLSEETTSYIKSDLNVEDINNIYLYNNVAYDYSDTNNLDLLFSYIY